ncbi:MAG: alpha/beta hydrolase [Usitatibacteraceae bacterium]
MIASGRVPLLLLLLLPVVAALAATAEKVVDIPTRSGVTQRMLVLSPPESKAVAILFAGGHGGLQIAPDGALAWGKGNFLVRSRTLFADQGFMTIVLDAPSDRQHAPFLGGFRQTADHAADVRAVIAWARMQSNAPVWLVGTSRGTQSVAYLATELSGTAGPDGIVLTSTILRDDKGRAVPAMPLAKFRLPVLVVHHENDGCTACRFNDIPSLMDKLGASPRKQLIVMSKGENRGDPCEAFAFHGFNGLEHDVVGQIAAWILAK